MEVRDDPEIVTCYNKGTKIDRVYVIQAIDSFCNEHMGQVFAPGQLVEVSEPLGTFLASN